MPPSRGRFARRSDFWRLREAFSEAQKGAGGSIKHDISVPVARIPEFLERAAASRRAAFALARGRCRSAISATATCTTTSASPRGWTARNISRFGITMSEAIFALVTELDGSISAEHGIGQMKRDALVRYKSAVEIDMMRAIKHALDPKGILNPGKLL